MKYSHAILVLVVSLLAACSSDSISDRQQANQAPTISAIPAIDTVANRSSQPIAFSLGDEDVDALTIAVSSDRPLLVPNDAITMSGSGPERSLAITPVVDMTGDAMITVIAEDAGGLAASSAFLLTVTPEQKSMAQFARDTFRSPEGDEPALINAIEFTQDADDDNFGDLLMQ